MNLPPLLNKASMLLAFVLPALFLAQGAASLEPFPPGFAPARGGMRSENPALANSSENLDPALVPNLYASLPGYRGPGAAARGRGLPTKGSPKMLILLVDFDEHPARPSDTAESMRDRIFGTGGSFPYESLSAYYTRSSLGQLNIRGDVLGWYRAGLRAEVPQTVEGRDELIKKALLSFKGLDLSQYDNNGDGVVDYFGVVWAGPTGDWATFWWGCATRFADREFRIGGVGLGSYSWQSVIKNWDAPDAPFSVRTLIHETGHSLGLPDYYDYKPGVGPGGGLGNFDMMDSARFDHNCFSKMALGWIRPKVVTFDGEFGLEAAEDSGDCVLAVPAGQEANFSGEYFLVEKRVGSGNDAALGSGGGLVVWHVDARQGAEGGLLYNNSTTEHKLLKFLEADGLEELESGKRKEVTQEDFFAAGGLVGPGTAPSSRLYDGEDSGLVIALGSGAGTASVSVKYPAQPVLLAER